MSSINCWLAFHGLKRNLGNVILAVCELFKIGTPSQPKFSQEFSQDQDLDLMVKDFFDRFERWLEGLHFRYLRSKQKGKARVAKNLLASTGDENFSYSLSRIRVAVMLETLGSGTNKRSQEALFKLVNFVTCFAREMVLGAREELIGFFNLFRLLLDVCPAGAAMPKIAAALFFLSKQFDLEPFIRDFLKDKFEELRDVERSMLEDAERVIEKRRDYLRGLFPFFSGGRPQLFDDPDEVTQHTELQNGDKPEESVLGHNSESSGTPFFNQPNNISREGFYDNFNENKEDKLVPTNFDKKLSNQNTDFDSFREEVEEKITTFADFRKLLIKVMRTRGSSEPLEFQINMLQVWRQFKGFLRHLGADRMLKGKGIGVFEDVILLHNLVVLTKDVLTLLSLRSQSQEGGVGALSESQNFEDAASCLTTDIFDTFVRISFAAQRRGLVSGFLLFLDLMNIAYSQAGTGDFDFWRIIQRNIDAECINFSFNQP